MLHFLILCFLREFLDSYSKLSIDSRSLLLYFLSSITFMVLRVFLFYSVYFSFHGFITFSGLCTNVTDRFSCFWFALVFDAVAFLFLPSCLFLLVSVGDRPPC